MNPASPWPRRDTRPLSLGGLVVGGGAPISVQSMLSVSPAQPEAALAELARLGLAGCDVVRVALPDREALAGLPSLVAASSMPLVADVHFDLELGIEAIESAGVAGLRVNPGTAGKSPPWARLARAADAAGACIRVGANAGSASPSARANTKGLAWGLVEDVLDTATLLAEAGAPSLKLSVKSARAPELVQANRLLAEAADRVSRPGWPLHLGLTEAGPPPQGELKSAAALAILLAEGLGDTLRVSLTADPVWEVRAAHRLLRALGLGRRGVDLIACPTCGRCQGDVISVAGELRARLDALPDGALDGLALAVMGCEVNGPGEARAADVGAAAAQDHWVLFVRGRAAGRVGSDEVVARLLALAFDLAKGSEPPPLSSEGSG